MKKFLSLLMAVTLVAGLFTTVTGLTVFGADESLTAEVWSPVEITLESSVDYKKPFVETEIDAVFTHTDGTKISLPGFWKEDDTWAVRFSPTKTGEWSYIITCKDETNTGLTATGKVTAVETTKDTDIAKHGFITTVKDQHYYQYADGTPFFWLGDTNWQAFSQVSTTVCNYPGCTCSNQFKHIVDNRLEKGFTVYQTYFVPGSGNGEKSVWKDSGKFEQPNTDVFNDKVDAMFSYLGEKGMVIALGLGCHTATMNVMKIDAVMRFARYIVARYACYPIVWISGQEITDLSASATSGMTAFDCYIQMSESIEQLDGYKHPNSAHMYPMQATDTRALRLDLTDWHDSWTIQGGHGGVAKAKTFYSSYYRSANSGFTKPFIEAEANYEDINCGGFTGYDANRISAWKSMVCGSAGFTYGVSGIWANCFSTKTFTGWYDGESSYSYDPWYMGLDKPGSYEMTYMKNFFLNLGAWQDLVPRYSDVKYATFLSHEECILSSTEDKSMAVAYFYDSAMNKTGAIKCLDDEKTYDAYWFNPLNGKYIVIEKGIKTQNGSYDVPDKPSSQDWVFVITANGLGAHYEESQFVDLNKENAQVTPTGTKVTPVSVKAVGGITYKGGKKDSQTMTDNTLWLYDDNASTVWVPNANRTSQTFLFDLGSSQKLTHMTITPADGTIIPRFRIEGSNDGKTWTIITNTVLRDVNAGKCSEPLDGTFRYVKVLLLNAETLKIDEKDVSTLPYKGMYNKQTKNAYSVTEITDIAIYSNGEGTPTEDKLVASTLIGDINNNSGNQNGTDNQPGTDNQNGAVSLPGDDNNASGATNNAGNGNTVIIVVVISVAAVCVLGAAAYVIVTLKKSKKKEN